MKSPELTVALLVTPESTSSTLFGMYDLFKSVQRDWHLLQKGVPGESLFSPRLVGRTLGSLTIANGVKVEVTGTLESLPLPDIVCLPDIFLSPNEPLAGRYDREVHWLRACYDAGAVIAAACSGTLLLAEAGLLDGRDATTHWGYCEALSRQYPSVRVHPDRALVVSGDEHRLVMAGGGTSWQDLALYLIARSTGLRYAQEVAKIYLIDWHSAGQQPYAVLSRTRQADDPIIGKCQSWVGEHYDSRSPVAAMLRLSGLSERSFKRRFRKATGLTPIQYVHTLRLEEAKHWLESSDVSVECIAGEVGYEDMSFFSRLFRREVGLTPTQYRRRFGALRRALEAHHQPGSAALADSGIRESKGDR